MTALWNLPFAVLVLLGFAVRTGHGDGWTRALAPVVEFFGYGRRAQVAVADLLTWTGVIGLLFVAWSGRMDTRPDLWLTIDCAVSASGGGLITGWLLDRLSAPEPLASAVPSMEVISVDGLPHRPESGPVTAPMAFPPVHSESDDPD